MFDSDVVCVVVVVVVVVVVNGTGRMCISKCSLAWISIDERH